MKVRRPPAAALAVFALGAAACAAPAAAPPPDERLATLPADASFVARLDAPTLLGEPAVADVLAGFGVEGAALAELGGGGGLRADSVVLGCGAEGCVALLEGDFRDGAAAVDALTARPPAGLSVARAGGALGLDAVSAAGDDVVLRILAADKAVVGDREAVRGAWERQGQGGLDPAEVAAAVPPTESWVLVRGLGRLQAQVVARAEARSPGSGEAWRARVADLRARVPEVDAVEALALGLALDGGAVVQARATCADEATALALEARARASRLGSEGAVRREGRVVEAAGALALAGWGTP